jgi:hypothetical protein
MRAFSGFATFASFTSKVVNGHHRIPVIQAPWRLTREIAVTAWTGEGEEDVAGVANRSDRPRSE